MDWHEASPTTPQLMSSHLSSGPGKSSRLQQSSARLPLLNGSLPLSTRRRATRTLSGPTGLDDKSHGDIFDAHRKRAGEDDSSTGVHVGTKRPRLTSEHETKDHREVKVKQEQSRQSSGALSRRFGSVDNYVNLVSDEEDEVFHSSLSLRSTGKTSVGDAGININQRTGRMAKARSPPSRRGMPGQAQLSGFLFGRRHQPSDKPIKSPSKLSSLETSRKSRPEPKYRSDQLGPTYRSRKSPPMTIVRRPPIRPARKSKPTPDPTPKSSPQSMFPSSLPWSDDTTSIKALSTPYSGVPQTSAAMKRMIGPFLQEESDEDDITERLSDIIDTNDDADTVMRALPTCRSVERSCKLRSEEQVPNSCATLRSRPIREQCSLQSAVRATEQELVRSLDNQAEHSTTKEQYRARSTETKQDSTNTGHNDLADQAASTASIPDTSMPHTPRDFLPQPTEPSWSQSRITEGIGPIMQQRHPELSEDFKQRQQQQRQHTPHFIHRREARAEVVHEESETAGFRAALIEKPNARSQCKDFLPELTLPAQRGNGAVTHYPRPGSTRRNQSGPRHSGSPASRTLEETTRRPTMANNGRPASPVAVQGEASGHRDALLALAAKAQAANKKQATARDPRIGSGDNDTIVENATVARREQANQENGIDESAHDKTSVARRMQVERERRIRAKKARNERYRELETTTPAEEDDLAQEDREGSRDEDLEGPDNAKSGGSNRTPPFGPFALNSVRGLNAVSGHHFGKRSYLELQPKQTDIGLGNAYPRPSTTFEPINLQQTSTRKLKRTKTGHRRKLGTISLGDLLLVKWRGSGMHLSEIVDCYAEKTGLRRSEKTLSCRASQVAKAIRGVGISYELCEDAVADKPGSNEELNRLVRRNELEQQQQPRQDLESDSLRSPAHRQRHTRGIEHTATSSTSSRGETRSARTPNEVSGDDGLFQAAQRPVQGGKQPNWDLLKSYWDAALATNVEEELTTEDPAQNDSSRESSVDPHGFIHFAYQVERRQCTKQQVDDDGITIEDTEWHEVGEPHQSLEEANAAACGPALLMTTGDPPIVDVLGAYNIEKDALENGEACCAFRSRRGMVQTRVIKKLRTFLDRISAKCKVDWVPKTLYHIKQRITLAQGGDKLFDDGTSQSQESFADDSTSADLAWANTRAVQIFAGMTYEIRFASLTLRDLEMHQLRLDLTEQLERKGEGAMFSECKQMKDRLVEVWVDKGKLVGPRNL